MKDFIIGIGVSIIIGIVTSVGWIYIKGDQKKIATATGTDYVVTQDSTVPVTVASGKWNIEKRKNMGPVYILESVDDNQLIRQTQIVVPMDEMSYIPIGTQVLIDTMCVIINPWPNRVKIQSISDNNFGLGQVMRSDPISEIRVLQKMEKDKWMLFFAGQIVEEGGPINHMGLRDLKGWKVETKCIHCGGQVVKQWNGSWVHLTFRKDSSGYESCADHKAKIMTGRPSTVAEVDKKLFPDPPPYKYKHRVVLSAPIEYDSLQDGTEIFFKDFQGDCVIVTRYDSTGWWMINKRILFHEMPNGVSMYCIETRKP